jgi:hypothetical protein
MNEGYNTKKIIDNINLINQNNINKNINIYFNIKNSNGYNYIKNDTKELSLFFCGCKNNFDKKYNYQFITINSLNPNKYNYEYLSNERYNFVKSKMGKYSKNYNYKKDGYILLLLSNSGGWFRNNIINNSFINCIINLIKNIRKYTEREIIIRLHPKDLEKKDLINSIKKNNFINVELKTDNLNDTLNNCYCCFIQNSKMIFDLVNKGIPLFNLNFYDVNYFNNIYIKMKDIENLDNIKLPDRESFLKYNYRLIFFKYELYEKNSLSKILKYYNIIND